MSARPEPLPPACGRCRDYGGLWSLAAGGGLKRCGCARGVRLAALDAARMAPTKRRACALPAVRDWKAAAAGEGAARR
jgi:hypothetical protein